MNQIKTRKWIRVTPVTLHAWSTPTGSCTIFYGSQSQGGATDAAVMRVQMYTCGEYRHLVYIAHKELHNCKLPFLFKGSTNTLESGMPGELLHFCIFVFLFQKKKKNTKGKQRVEEKGSLCDLLIFFSKSPKKFIFYGVFMKEKAHLMRTN